MLETCTPGIIVGTEPYQHINAGLLIFPGTCTPAQPGCLRRRAMAARRHLLERERVHLPRRADPPPPSTTLSDEQVFGLATALMHAEHNRMAALPCQASLLTAPVTTSRPLVPGLVPWCGPPLTMPNGPKPASRATTPAIDVDHFPTYGRVRDLAGMGAVPTAGPPTQA